MAEAQNVQGVPKVRSHSNIRYKAIWLLTFGTPCIAKQYKVGKHRHILIQFGMK